MSEPQVIGWEPVQAEWWLVIRATLPKPWPREAVLMDLRFWRGQEVATAHRAERLRVKRPGRYVLQQQWGWSDWDARQAFKAEDEWARPCAEAPSYSTPTALPLPSHTPPMTTKANAGNIEESSYSTPTPLLPPSHSPPRARSLLRDPEIQSTEIRSEFRPSAIPEQTPQVHLFPPIGFTPAEAAGASSPVQTPAAIPEAPIKPPGAVSGASEEKPAPQLSPDVMAVWQAWKSWRPGSGPVPPDSVAPMLKAAVKKYKADLVIDVIRWAQSSPHSRARFLRGERNGVVDRNELCTIKTVLRHLDEYGEFVRAEAASQPWQRAQAAGGTVIDPEGNVEPIKPQKPAGKRSDSFESAVSTYDLAQRLRAEEEAHHGFGS